MLTERGIFLDKRKRKKGIGEEIAALNGHATEGMMIRMRIVTRGRSWNLEIYRRGTPLIITPPPLSMVVERIMLCIL